MKTKLSFKNILTVIKKELVSYLDSPAAYVVLVVFLGIWFFLFFRSVFVIGEASLNNLFGMFPWFGLVLIAAVTMGTVAKEKDDGTLEFVMTHPIRELEFILGKLGSASIFVSITSLFTLPVAILFSKYGAFDWGVYVGQLLGMFLFSISLISLGIFLSSLFSSQIAALLATLAAGFILILAGTELLTISLPFSVAAVLERLSLVSHYNAVIRGVIDFYDILYFVAFTVVFIILTLLQLLKRKYGDYKARYSVLQIMAGSIIFIIVIAGSLRVWLPLRLDITQGRIYTLSKQTKSILRNLPDKVTITLYASDKLPSQYAPVLRDIKYLAGDYKTIAGSKLDFVTKDPGTDPEMEQSLAAKGIQKIQFNVIGQEELQLKNGYLGMLVEYGDKFEVIPFVSATNDLEYQLTSLISKLASDNKPTVAFLNVAGSKTIAQYNYFAGELQKQFNVTTIILNKETPEINDTINTLIIAGPTQQFDEITVNAIKSYLEKGKNLILFAESFDVNTSLVSAAMNNNIESILGDYGVTVNKDIAFDLQSFSRISFRDGVRTLVAPYPYWIMSQINDDNAIGLKYVQSVVLFWPSSLSIDTAKLSAAGFTESELLYSSPQSGSDVNPAQVLAPSEEFPSNEIGKKVLAVVLTPNGEAGSTKGRIAVVGDSDFLIDNLIQRNPENIAFGSGLVSWVSGVDSLADIQIKGNVYSLLKFTDQTQPSRIKFGVFASLILVPLIVAFLRYTRRKTLRFQKFSN